MTAFVVDIFGLRSFQNRFKESMYMYYILTLLFMYIPELKQITVVAFQPAHLAQELFLPKNQLCDFFFISVAKYSQTWPLF